ncbi:MAG: hypothetical protein ABEJ82_02100 [Haloplanus sp.]
MKAGTPPAAITAGIGVGATGVAGDGIESETKSIAVGVAQAVGVDPQFGPLLLIAGAVLIMALAFILPGVFEDAR